MATKLARLWTNINAGRSQRYIFTFSTTFAIIWRTKTFQNLPNKFDHQYQYIRGVTGRRIDFYGNMSDI